ncbi:MAG: excinuclease ABC subunit UvrC [Bacteroidota bacterium]|nr:excinuclease ABC subunit UvrC [Bacteroidota bacterium]MDP4214868.1 excinuclease ABC subunit UvrC [Bacteroidota bacterium]MDP4244730.1 excinuclease ABC subunit UvrC [Bacteroidota bacterium]MDP4255490.1 excinuclease ABC subunit UvrC [Bacteroidota bacterium]MDP4257967.1 excinuclease ABC subunit UvrC [Bacteroidota bacterium]
MNQEEFSHIAHTIPGEPGIYKYFDGSRELIYVGKAKNLRKRVGSYFTKTFTTYKTHELVQRIRHIEFTIVSSEQDAFLLENSLIKQFQPRFNINLKDDKTYPYIVIKKEPFPRVFLTRHQINDGSEYLGPFTSVGKVRELLDLVKNNIQLRTCKLNLSETNIRKGKFKICLEYHLGNCKGPCEGLQTEEDYREGLEQLKNILKGNLGPVFQRFRREMKELAEKMDFEKAEIMRKKISHLESYQSRSVIVSSHLRDADVFSIARDGDLAYINYLMVQNGTIVQTHTTEVETHLEESDAEVLAFAMARLRDTFNSTTPEIVVPFAVDYPETGIRLTVPKGGDKKKLLDLSEKNVSHFREELKKKKMLLLEGKSPDERKQVLYSLMEDLQLSDLPVHIECFDNSNFQGSFPVSAMVCFRNGVESKKDYRHFNVKTVQGINDFATMKEVVHRRYKRLLDERQSLPQLVIIDGGKGQLSAAMESIVGLGLTGMMTVIGLAKNEEEIFFPADTESVKLPYNSDSLQLIRRIRDEVHRFGISFHRKKRSQGTFVNELERIEGIGQQTANQLLKAFRSVRKVRETSEEALAAIIGPSKAKLVRNWFEKEDREEPQDDV